MEIKKSEAFPIALRDDIGYTLKQSCEKAADI